MLRGLQVVDVVVVGERPLWQPERLGELRRVLTFMWSSS